MNISNIITTIGNTPLLKLAALSPQGGPVILAKQESRNPLGSIKDRVAFNLVKKAEEQGKIGPDSVIIEPTSGNTGLGLAFICAVKKIRLILTMPENMSLERRKMLAHLGAELVLTPARLGMSGAIDEAEKIRDGLTGGFIPNQFSNPACTEIHQMTTGPEIWEQTEGKIDIFAAGVGTGGTITGAGEYLKAKNPAVTVIAVEPESSPILSGGKAASHNIQGIGAGFIPDILNIDLIDEVIKVSDEAAILTARRLAAKEGVFCGISSGAAVWSAIQLAKRPENAGKNIVTILPDTGERYLSTSLLANGCQA
ncbi:MAG: cysteine synthase A [Deltaproteobacteria bacterium]|nr:MAG: cysteine synthase A [Deltaproteobacteria bacterium]